jgi:hypothetical protein
MATFGTRNGSLLGGGTTPDMGNYIRVNMILLNNAFEQTIVDTKTIPKPEQLS